MNNSFPSIEIYNDNLLARGKYCQMHDTYRRRFLTMIFLRGHNFATGRRGSLVPACLLAGRVSSSPCLAFPAPSVNVVAKFFGRLCRIRFDSSLSGSFHNFVL